MIKIAIAYGEKLFVQLLEGFFKRERHVQCLFTAQNGKELLNQIKKSHQLPDLILLDLKMQDMEGIKLVEILRENYPQVKYLLMSSHYKKSFTGHILKMGANALIPKEISLDHLLNAIQSVHNKGYYFIEEQIDTLRAQIKPHTPKPKFVTQDEFTEREKQILQLLCEQYTAKEIAEKLYISRRTVEGHKDNLFAKTGARNLAGLVIYAIQNQLINYNNLSTSSNNCLH